MANAIIASFLIVLFVLAVGVVGTLLVRGAVSRHRDRRTPEERWADEHGDEDPDKVKLWGGPNPTGSSGGGGIG